MANQFNSFNDFWILAIYCCYLYGFKNVRNVIEMALKLLFLSQNYKNRPAAGDSDPRPLFVTHLSGISLFSTGPKLENFWAKNFAFGSNPLPLSKIQVALLVAFTAADRFFERLCGPHTKGAKKRCGPYASLFSEWILIFQNSVYKGVARSARSGGQTWKPGGGAKFWR